MHDRDELDLPSWIEDASPALLRQLRRSIGPHLSRYVEPEDVLQDSLLALLRDRKPNEPRSPRDWRRRVLAIARNRILMIARRDSLGVVVSDNTSGSYESRGPDPRSAEPLGWRALVAGLDLDQRVSLLLRDWLGMPWESIAFVLARPSKNAAQLLHYRARRAARTMAARREAPGTTHAYASGEADIREPRESRAAT